MLLYTNKFAVSTDDNQEEVIFNFLQQSPIVNKTTGNNEGIEVSPVTSLVMTKDCAKKLAQIILSVLDEPEDNTND